METSLPFVDPFAVQYGAGSAFADYSSMPLFSPGEDFGSGFGPESVGSPMSPVSPVLSASSYGFINADDFSPWESFGQPTGFEGAPLTPAINPMDLVVPSNYPSPYYSPPLSARQLHLKKSTSGGKTRPQPPSAKPRSTSPASKKGEKTSSSSDELSRTSLKRKAPSAEDRDVSPSSKGSQLPPKKVAHNEIEKRYRTNLNDRIVELRDSIPSLRKAALRRMGEDVDSVEDNIEEGFCPAAHKLNKAAILSKATEYICHLRSRNCYLAEENKLLNSKLQSFEMMAAEMGIRWPN